MPASTPRRAGQQAPEGAVFTADVFAYQLRTARLLAGLEQTDVAARMRLLGHPTWTRATVSQVERGQRNITAVELLAAALALGVTVADLLNPRPTPFGGSHPVVGRDVAVGSPARVLLLVPRAVEALTCGHTARLRVDWQDNELAGVELEDVEL